MLHEALLASEILRESRFNLKVVNMPWLNRVDTGWLEKVIASCPAIYVVGDHAPVGGLGDSLLNQFVASRLIDGRRFKKLAVEGYPAWGAPQEVLQYHDLDATSLARRILVDQDSVSRAQVSRAEVLLHSR
jgi:transketolase C-terminal domain/subunit